MTTTTHRITAGIAVALALATSASTASAASVDVAPGGTSVRIPNYTSQAGNGSPNVQPATGSASAPSGGFDWGDAGIGAAGGVGLSIACLGGALAATHRRSRPPRRETALTS